MVPIAPKNSDWKDGFLFLANNLALDFLNTRPVIDGEPKELLSDFPALLRWFHAARLLPAHANSRIKRQHGSTRAAQSALQQLLEFREQLREQMIRWEEGKELTRKALDRLNYLLAHHPLPSQLNASGKNLNLQTVFDPQTPDDLFAPIAHAAAELLTKSDRRRIRRCTACVLHFLDTSKKGTRRWCSMQLCGNRIKVAAYHARRHVR